jgi:hypothetical protein
VREIVAPDTGVRVEVQKRLVLRGEADQQAHEERVLEDVGEVADVEHVAIGQHVLSELSNRKGLCGE